MRRTSRLIGAIPIVVAGIAAGPTVTPHWPAATSQSAGPRALPTYCWHFDPSAPIPGTDRKGAWEFNPMPGCQRPSSCPDWTGGYCVLVSIGRAPD